MPRPISIEYLDEIQDGFNQHDVDAILSTFTTDCVWLMARGPHAPEGQKCIGKKENQYNGYFYIRNKNFCAH